ncbi:hypothetical protein [Sphingobium fuliginis]|jgi:hypothetical protein|uniref:hypothetical protein n=1 Tax=Sphingobium fuliginis (strain ATCC 27551) TaxID=336203 RepID=UPI0037C964E9
MKGDDDDSHKALGCKCLAVGATTGHCVICTDKIAKEYEKLEDRVQARLERAMLRWCDGHALTPEMFNGNEGRSVGNLMLQVFKTHKVRLYGYETTLQGRRTFIIVERDLAKKQNKADQELLKRAKNNIDAKELDVDKQNKRSRK